MSKLKYGEVQFLYSEINGLKEPTREIRKKLDNLEEVLIATLQGGDGKKLDDESNISLANSRVFSQDEIESMLPENINRGQRKAFEYLLVDKPGELKRKGK